MDTDITPASANESIDFDGYPAGKFPAGWIAGVTGHGAPRWTVEADPGAPTARHVLRQSGVGDFPWCVRTASALADGFVEVRFRPEGGRDDQAGGVVWRWKSGDEYYVARANALEDNVSLYYTDGGKRRTIRYVDAPVPGNAWHVIRVEFQGSRIRVLLDGHLYMEEDDTHIVGAGRVGMWTKADSVTAFEDFRYGLGGA